jgi:general secretion pathway protein E
MADGKEAESRSQRLAVALQTARAMPKDAPGSMLDRLLDQGLTPGELAVELPRLGCAVLPVGESPVADLSRWNHAMALQYRCVVLRAGNAVQVGAEDPWNEAHIQRVARFIGEQPAVLALRRSEFERLVGAASDEPPRPPEDRAKDVKGPIVEFVDHAIRTAHAQGASDIHFECDRAGVTVKLRLDGVMRAFERLEGAEPAQETISRIKVLGQLDITERRLPQDGRFRTALDGAELDLRVSIMPSVHGEDAVLRLLDRARLREGSGTVSLDHLGFPATDAQRIRDLAAAPSGMLLITGPTGSGKTTTVYAALSEINTGLEKIITIEDPVEYELPGVLQIPVNERKGLTFAKGLRSILRHDPDRILVGEIRDAETAEIAVQSALTGHLVFTTVHANSVGDIIGRFRHFGLDMFGFMSSLNGIVVQRLVRRLCPSCRGLHDATPVEIAWLARNGHVDQPRLAHAVGCAECAGSGYQGRFVIAELHLVDDGLRDRVTSGAPPSVIKAHAIERGVVGLEQQAAQCVLAGRTSYEEIRRVVGGV